jgi:hypothetical protein
MAAANDNGPDNANGIVWALGMFSFFIHSYFLLTKYFIYQTTTPCRLQTMSTTRYDDGNRRRRVMAAANDNGPDDANGIVWALGTVFFYSLLIFSNEIFCY